EYAALAVARQLGKLVAIDRAGEDIAVPAARRPAARQRHEDEAEHQNRQHGEQGEDNQALHVAAILAGTSLSSPRMRRPGEIARRSPFIPACAGMTKNI